MTKQPKRPRDPNQLAKRIVDIATGEATDTPRAGAVPNRAKGGQIGGKARAESLSAEKRSAIAKRAADKRWGK